MYAQFIITFIKSKIEDRANIVKHFSSHEISFESNVNTKYLDRLDIKSEKIFGERSVNTLKISGQKTVDLRYLAKDQNIREEHQITQLTLRRPECPGPFVNFFIPRLTVH